MMVGGLLLILTALRLPSELKDDSSKVQQAGSTELCVGLPCRANDDRRPARGYETPSIAVDPANGDHQVVGDENLVGGQCGWHTTFDGGKTWTDGTFDVPAEFGLCTLDSAGLLPMGNVAMGADPNRVYAVFSTRKAGLRGERAGSGGDGTLLVESIDGGKTFSTAREILVSSDPQLSYVRPQLTVSTDPAGVDRLLVTVWGCGPGRCTQGYFYRSDDAGKTFTAPVLVTPEGGNSPSAAILAEDGTVYMTFLRRLEGQDHELLLARSGDDGKTFASVVIDRRPALGIQYDSAKLHIDPKRGFFYLLFADERDQRPEVFFRRSQDQGATWEKAVRIHTSPGGSAYSPSMAVSPDGRIDVIFYRETRRNIQDVHVTFSDDGGKTFAVDEKINDKTIDRELGYWDEVGNDSIPVVASTSTAAYFAWSDTRNATDITNTQEILTKTVERKPAAP
ncbi:MAG: sialidase family protein [Acidimicrobiales bacterium]